jgi:predicted SprT family Zn-dependent metalloprotease
MSDITSKEYVGLEEAYNFLNRELFDDQLPGCLITIQTKSKSKAAGHYAPSQFKHRKEKESTDEIAFNAATFRLYSDIEILSTMVHEMCHLWQRHFGKPSRSGYHNREWAKKMEIIGMMPSTTGEPGGNRTGQRMGDYIITGGLFETKAKEIIEKGFEVNWESVIQVSPTREPGQGTNGQNDDKKIYKYKYTCPECNIRLWGKPGLNIICGNCQLKLVNESEPESEPAEIHHDEEQAVKTEKTEVPFFLNIKDLMTWLRRRWRNREKAEAYFIFPENTMYKEFRFFTFKVEEKKGRRKVKERWYNWTLITKYNSEEKGKADYILHRAAAEMIRKIQKPFKVFFIRDYRVKYFDPEKNQLRPAKVQGVGEIDVGIKFDDGQFESADMGYLVPVNPPGKVVQGKQA